MYCPEHDNCLNCNMSLETVMHSCSKRGLHKLFVAFNPPLWHSSTLVIGTLPCFTHTFIPSLRHGDLFTMTSRLANRLDTRTLYIQPSTIRGFILPYRKEITGINLTPDRSLHQFEPLNFTHLVRITRIRHSQCSFLINVSCSLCDYSRVVIIAALPII